MKEKNLHIFNTATRVSPSLLARLQLIQNEAVRLLDDTEKWNEDYQSFAVWNDWNLINSLICIKLTRLWNSLYPLLSASYFKKVLFFCGLALIYVRLNALWSALVSWRCSMNNLAWFEQRSWPPRVHCSSREGRFFDSDWHIKQGVCFKRCQQPFCPRPLLPPFVCEWRSMSQTGLLVRLADPPADLSLLLFMEEVASRLLLFQLGRSYLCHAAWTVEFGCRERDSEDFTYTSLCVCQISFLSILSKLKHNKQGEVILLQLTTTG